MLKTIISFGIYGLIFYAINTFASILGFSITSEYGLVIYIFVGGVAYMINKIVRPIVSFLFIPINIITLGLIGIFINIFMIYILQFLVNSFFGVGAIAISSILGVFVLSIILSFIYKILDIFD